MIGFLIGFFATILLIKIYRVFTWVILPFAYIRRKDRSDESWFWSIVNVLAVTLSSKKYIKTVWLTNYHINLAKAMCKTELADDTVDTLIAYNDYCDNSITDAVHSRAMEVGISKFHMACQMAEILISYVNLHMGINDDVFASSIPKRITPSTSPNTISSTILLYEELFKTEPKLSDNVKFATIKGTLEKQIKHWQSFHKGE